MIMIRTTGTIPAAVLMPAMYIILLYYVYYILLGF